MKQTLVYKILSKHIVDGKLAAGEQIGIHIDQTLTQDATGTTAFLLLESMGVSRVKTDLSVSYIDHNIARLWPGKSQRPSISANYSLYERSLSFAGGQRYMSSSPSGAVWQARRNIVGQRLAYPNSRRNRHVGYRRRRLGCGGSYGRWAILSYLP